MPTMVEPSSSRSRCVHAVHQHSFKIPNFSQLQGIGGAGTFVSSTTFLASGRGWNIRIYPDGWNEDTDEYVSAFLTLVDVPNPEDAKTQTSYTLELLNKYGKVSHSGRLSHTFEAVDTYWGFSDFVKKSKLKPLLLLDDDCFTVRCALTVLDESQSEPEDNVVAAAPPTVAEDEVPEPNMQRHFGHMLKAGKGKDVTFDVGGQIFHAHRCVLAARSPVFEAELFGPMKEKSTEEPIRVDDMEPSVFEELLHFIYTDSVSSNSKDDGGNDDNKNVCMQHLLVAADRYGLDRLRIMCEVSLCQSIDVQTVATTLALAEQHHFALLKGVCLKFLALRDVLGAVMKTEGFKHLVASCPFIAVEILDKVAEESLSL